MRTLLIGLALTFISHQTQAQEISVDEFSLMTVPELAGKAHSECSDREEHVRKAKAAIEGNANFGAMYTLSMPELKKAEVNEGNLGRIKLVVRKQLDGEVPNWAELYAAKETSNTGGGCERAKVQYAEWAKNREASKAVQKKGAPSRSGKAGKDRRSGPSDKPESR